MVVSKINDSLKTKGMILVEGSCDSAGYEKHLKWSKDIAGIHLTVWMH